MRQRQTFSFSNALKEIKDWVLQRHNEENPKAKEKGAFFGKLGQPRKDEPVSLYIQPHIDAYALIWKDAKQRLDNLSNTVETFIEQLQKAAEALNAKINGFERDIAHLESELTQHKTEFPLGLFIVLMLCLIGLLSAETLYNAKVFALLELNWLFTLLLACGITVGMVIAFYQRSKLMKYCTAKWQKVLIIIVWILGFTVFFYLLAEYRNDYMKEVGDGQEFSITLYILFNWILLGASEFVVSKLPKTEAIKALAKRASIKSKISALRDKIRESETELDDILESESGYNRSLVNMPNETDNIKELVRISMNQSVSDFLLENLKHRKDGHSPLGGYTPPDEPLTLG